MISRDYFPNWCQIGPFRFNRLRRFSQLTQPPCPGGPHSDNGTSFGTRGSQVQILPLRPAFSQSLSIRGQIWGTKRATFPVLARRWRGPADRTHTDAGAVPVALWVSGASLLVSIASALIAWRAKEPRQSFRQGVGILRPALVANRSSSASRSLLPSVGK